MMLSIQIAKFKFRQYQMRVVSPNLMLAKVTRYAIFQLDPPKSGPLLSGLQTFADFLQLQMKNGRIISFFFGQSD